MTEESCSSIFFDHEVQHIYPTPNTSQESDVLSLSQLTLEDSEHIRVGNFFNLTPRCMPESPHRIMEEQFSWNPWALLVATIFLSKTSGKHARPVMQEFFDRYSTPYDLLESNPSELEQYFEFLGLKKRGEIIWKMTYQYISARWKRASDLYGIGKYGEDAFRLFCMGHTDLEPDDRYLKVYIDWLRGHTDFLESEGVDDCQVLPIEDPVLKYYGLSLKSSDKR